MGLWDTLAKRSGLYSKHYLLKLYNGTDPDSTEYYITDNNADIVYKNHTYHASAFRYTPKSSSYGFDGGGRLEIAATESNIINLIELNKNIYVDATLVIVKDGEVSELTSYKHKYCTVSGNRQSISIDFDKDDRLSMTFPTLIWSTQNNRGNA